ncbi:MAG TPA: HAD family phosphatase [Pseudonocardiaceae bacterium]
MAVSTERTWYRAVLFDMDGVVVDTEAQVAAFWRGLAAEHGFALTGAELERHVFGRSADHTLRTLFACIPPHRHPEVYQRMQVNDQTRQYTPIARVVPLLRELHAAGVPTALVTGAQPTKAAAVLDALDLAGVFGTVVHAEDVAAGKPDRACYRLAAHRLDVAASQCVVFEDAVSGVSAATAAGATCVALTTPERRAGVLAAGAAATITDFREVGFDADRLHIGEVASFRFTTAVAERDQVAAD